jgi:PKD repeat protein
MDRFKNWSTLEYALLAGVALLICAIGVVAVLLVGGIFVEERIARPDNVASPTRVATAGSTVIPVVDPGQGSGAEEGSDTRSITLSASSGEPGTVLTVSGTAWPAGSRVIVSLVPSEPPPFVVNSAVVNETGAFSTEIIVPSDPRWLDESPVPVLVQQEDGGGSAQAMLTIIATPGDAGLTPVPVVSPTPAQPTPTPQPPAQGAPQATVNASGLNVRTGPGTNYDIVGVLLNGQKVEITGRNADATWYQIRFSGSPAGVGWVAAAYVTAENVGNVPVVQAPPPPSPPPPTPTPAPQFRNWVGEYFNNPDLSGAPALVRDDPAISFDWGLGSPASQIPSDNFSARWSRTLNFSAGVYRFYTRTDDGVRLWVDGALVINQWKDQSPTTYAANIFMSEGPHYIRMEYYDRAMGAVAMLSWERADQFPDWKVEYFNNSNLGGSPVLVRNEASINYNWGTGSPAPGTLPNDNFSARWTRRLSLESGDYVVRVRSDDGLRVWVDNNLMVDRWQDGDTGWIEVGYSIPSGIHEYRVEYYERFGNAFVSFATWKKDQPDTPPSAVISAPSDSLAGQPINFDASRSRRGTNAIARYEWQFGDGGKAEGQRVSHTYTAPAEFKVRLKVFDTKGLSDETSVRIRIREDLIASVAPIANINAPSTAVQGDPVSFDGSRSQSASPISEYNWAFGDGGTGSGPVANHTYNQPGMYNVRLVVVAQNGLRGSASQQIRVDSPQAPAPAAVINAPSQLEVGQEGMFDGSASRPPDQIIRYTWNFGDGSTADGRTVPHTFRAAGTYNVTLSVIAQDGQSNTSSQQVQVTQAAGPTPTPVPPQAPVIKSFTVSPQEITLGECVLLSWDFAGQDLATARILRNEEVIATDPALTGSQQDCPPGVGQVQYRLVVDSEFGGSAQQSQFVNVLDSGQPTPTPVPPTPVPTDTPVAPAATDTPIPAMTDTPLPPAADTPVPVPTDTPVPEATATPTPEPPTPAPEPPPASEPPQAVINGPAQGLVGDGLLFDASYSQSSVPIVAYVWDFGDGAVDNSSGIGVGHSYGAPGAYTIRLTITDANQQQGTDTLDVQIDAPAVTLPAQPTPEPVPPTPEPAQPAPEPPQPVIDGPAQGFVGDGLLFDASYSQSGAPIVAYVWDFGDGTVDNSSGIGVGHSYAAPGVYNLTLTVTDQNGQMGSTGGVVQIDPVPVPQPQPAPLPQEPPPPQVEPPPPPPPEEPAPVEPAPQVEPPPAPTEEQPSTEPEPAPQEATPANEPAPESGGDSGGG